jgi:PKD repeat protein
MKIAMKYIYTTLLGLSLTFASAQQAVPQERSLAEVFQEKFERDRALAEEIAREKKIELRKKLADGRVMEFEGFDALGKLQFRATDNVGAGRTTSTNKVWPGGTVGTSLTGVISGNRLGVWDGGAVRATHQELTGRVTQVDGSTSIDDHATHVAGTMIASGVQANARGMAYQANIRAYDWNNDNSEMSSAGAGGMLVTNHSYGTITGWFLNGSTWVWYGEPSISNTADYKFGFYDSRAAEWDNIALNNPFMLICKSAGNDRGQVRTGTGEWQYSDGTPGTGTPPPADGGASGYDCISTYGNAKNILTVGAVRKINNSNTNNGWTQVSDVVMSTFSGWGPTDDGRIKPDVVGCGVSVYSPISTSNTAYDTYQGTSMASPNVSGSLFLVQQHFNNLKNRFMRAATLKALAIHTADEAGNAGPDYQYGWGLINTAKAVQLITDSSNNIIDERSLSNGSTYTTAITATGGTTPLRVTIVWHDRAGTPTSPQLNPTTRMLVNDLDLRVRRNSDNTVFFPYILDPATPAAAATTGDNIRDNVEQVFIAAPQQGTYTITVSHKGSLAQGQAQPFSIIISGVVGLPKAVFSTTNSTFICTNNSVSFVDQSSGSPTSRMWYFPGGNPATSTNASVNVSYATAGSYPVALRITNALGTDSIYIPNYVQVGGVTLPFLETFELNSPTASRWTVTNPNNDTTWRFETVGGTQPGNRAYCLPFYNYSQTGRLDQLTSPPISFRSYTNPVLTFRHAYARYTGGAYDSLRVFISTNCGSTYTRLASYGGPNFTTAADTEDPFIPTTDTQWCASNCITIPLNAYSGMNNIRIRFESYNNYGNNLYIDNVQITGSPLAPVAGFNVNKRTVCTNESVFFMDTSRNFPSQWQWTFDGANITTSSQQNPVVNYALPGQYTVRLRVANSTGADSIIRTDYINVIQGPALPVITANNTALCDGDSATLRTDSVANNYQWQRNLLNISGATSNSFTTSLPGVYILQVSSTNGCVLTSNEITLTSSSRPGKPIVSSSLSGNVMCTGGNAVLTSSSLTGNQWFRNGLAISGQTNRQLSINDSGSYTVQVTEQGCGSEFSDPRNVALLPKPQTSAITGPTAANVNESAQYSVTSTSGSVYVWTITGGTRTAGGNTASITVQWGNGPTGLVSVQETAQNGCKGDAVNLSVAVGPNQSVSEIIRFKSVSLYPVPAGNTLYIRIDTDYPSKTSLRLLNILGKELFAGEIDLKYGVNESELDLSGYANGVYLIELESGGEKQVKRIEKY